MKPTAPIIVTSTPAHRGDGVIPAAPPQSFEELRVMDKDQLRKLGLRPWDESGLMLFPGEWYGFIPAGFEVVDINGGVKKFDPGTTDDDIRLGCLAYGVVPQTCQ